MLNFCFECACVVVHRHISHKRGTTVLSMCAYPDVCDIVSGNPVLTCAEARVNDGLCGKAGKWFKPKQQKVTDMKLTEKQREQMLEAAKPLIKWMNENVHPECTAYVEHDKVKLMETSAVEITNEFIV